MKFARSTLSYPSIVFGSECLSPRPLSARGEQEERADWSWVMRLTGREQKDVARVTSDDEDTGDWQSKALPP